MIRTTGTYAALLALTVTSTSFAQTPAKDGRPQIRLSGEAKAETKPAEEAPQAEAKPAEGSTESIPVKEAAPAEGEPAESPVAPETPESQVSEQPAPGLGPADPVPGEGVTAEDAQKLSQPRVIDTSAPDDEADAAEPEEPPQPKIRGEELPFTHHVNHLDVALGFRVVGTHNDGLQPFLIDPVLVDTYLRAGGALGLSDRFAFAVHAEVGGASTSAYVRDVPSELNKVHVTAGLEGRYHFIHRMYAYGRVAPGLEVVNAYIGEGDVEELSNPEKVGSPAFQIDAALGAAIRFAGSSDGRKHAARAWAFVEGGYRYSGKHKLSLEMSEDGPRRTVPLELDPLSFSGGFFSTGVMLTY